MKNKITVLRVGIILVAGALALAAFFISENKSDVKEEKPITAVRIGEERFDVLIADTIFSRQLGLSGRPSLKENEGMLFIFQDSAVRGFWMKDMNFPLDIIWIDEDFVITGISRNVLPESYPESVSSGVPVKYVLEVNANIAEKRSIIKGRKVEFIR